jgi:putative tryptophan/tyrosine transport system substrate-binding protein
MVHVRRRQFITLLGGVAAAWPLAARAQQPALPVIGWLDPRSLNASTELLRRFRQGLKEIGYVDGENVRMEYRWGEHQIDRLPELAAELVRRSVTVIAASGAANPALAAKSATSTIPIVFIVGEDPVRLGLVASLNRPGGNLTGINLFSVELSAKRLELLRTFVPGATRMAVLVNPANATNAEVTLRDVRAAADSMRLRIDVFNASTIQGIDAVFATFEHERPDALFVGPDPFFLSRRVQLVHLATRHAIAASYSSRDYVEAGGLVSHGSNIAVAYREFGLHVGRILKGARPADLPVVQVSKLELFVNATAARMLGLTVSPTLLSLADEVIE